MHHPVVSGVIENKENACAHARNSGSEAFVIDPSGKFDLGLSNSSHKLRVTDLNWGNCVFENGYVLPTPEEAQVLSNSKPNSSRRMRS